MNPARLRALNKASITLCWTMRTNPLALALVSAMVAGPAHSLDAGPLGDAASGAAGTAAGAVGAAAGAVQSGVDSLSGTGGSAGGAAAGVGGSASTSVGGIADGALGAAGLGGLGQSGGQIGSTANQAGPSSAGPAGSTTSFSSPGGVSGSSAPAGFSSATASTVNGPRPVANGRGAPAGFSFVPLPLILLPVADPDHEPSIRPPGRADATGSVRLGPLASRPGTSAAVLAACRDAIAAAASPYGAARVEVVSAGRSRRMRGGGLAAPVEARVLYARNGRLQVRQAQVSCRLDAAGFVVAAR